MQEITNSDVLEFLRLLVNLGNVFHLNEENMTIEKSDGQAAAVQDGDQVKAIQILFNGMVRDENYAVLNPFKMVEGNNPALTWFYQSRITVLGVLAKKVIVKIAELGYTKEVEDYDAVQLISKVSEQCDETLVDELSKINASDYLRIFYNKKIKTAEAQTAIFTDALEGQHKFRKKTWEVLRAIFRGLFEMAEDEGTMSKYTYRATILSIPEIDAKLHVMNMLIKVLDPWTKKFLKTDLHAAEFDKHVGNLDTYARMYAWFTAKVSADKTISTVSNHAPGVMPSQSPAWNNQTAVPVGLPTATESSDNAIKVDMNPQELSPMPMAQQSTMPSMPMPSYGPVMPAMAMPGPVGMLASDVPATMPLPAGMPVGMMPASPMMMGMMPAAPTVGLSNADENRISVNI